MNKIKKYIILLLFIQIVIGCSEDAIVNPSEDYQLQKNIVGTWRFMDNRSFTFLANGTFIDSMKTISASSKYEPQNIIMGKYFIKNGILDYSELKLVYSIYPSIVTAPNYINYVQYYDMYLISTKDNVLKMQIIKVFEPDNSGSTILKGEWNSYQWVATYNINDNPSLSGGKLKEKFYFKPDSSICEYTSQFLFDTKTDPITNKRYSYTFNNSDLEITTKMMGFVQLNEGKLYLYSNKSIELEKQ